MAAMGDPDDLGIEDASHLTDADWAAINRLRRVLKSDGIKALKREMRTLLNENPVRYYTIMHAFFPRKTSEMIKDVAAELGVTEEEAIEMAEKMNAPSTKRH
jgi:hypothetical protein